MSNKSSIEWLFEQIARRQGSIFQTIPFYNDNYDLIQQAKEMHKKEIIDAHTIGYIIGGCDGDYLYDCKQYYNEAFGGKDEQ